MQAHCIDAYDGTMHKPSATYLSIGFSPGGTQNARPATSLGISVIVTIGITTVVMDS